MPTGIGHIVLCADLRLSYATNPNNSSKEVINMSELRYPNESQEYRDARDALLKEERELVDKVKSVAAKRRNLPLGGQLKEDYVFHWANDGKVGKSVKFSELFEDKNTLLLYSFMFGPNWDHPCPSCTSLVDGFDRTSYQVTRNAAFVTIAKAPADRINAWAKERGWSQIALVSGSSSAYQADYKCQGDSDDMQWPVMHVFRRQDGNSRVRLFVREAKRKVRIFSVSCRSAMNFVRESAFCVSHEKFRKCLAQRICNEAQRGATWARRA